MQKLEKLSHLSSILIHLQSSVSCRGAKPAGIQQTTLEQRLPGQNLDSSANSQHVQLHRHSHVSPPQLKSCRRKRSQLPSTRFSEATRLKTGGIPEPSAPIHPATNDRNSHGLQGFTPDPATPRTHEEKDEKIPRLPAAALGTNPSAGFAAPQASWLVLTGPPRRPGKRSSLGRKGTQANPQKGSFW